MSISRQQAQALSEGFLDTLGTDREPVFQPEEVYTRVIMLAGELIAEAQSNLHKTGSVAKGALADSLTAETPEENNGVFSIEITMLKYGLYINRGVQGTKSGAGDYAFKYELPSKKMLEALKDYLKGAKLKTASINKRSISKAEAKNVTLSEISSLYALGRSIKQHGIKANHFLDNAVSTISDKFLNDLSEALVIDVINAIPDRI